MSYKRHQGGVVRFKRKEEEGTARRKAGRSERERVKKTPLVPPLRQSEGGGKCVRDRNARCIVTVDVETKKEKYKYARCRA